MTKNRLTIIVVFIVSLGIGIAWAIHRPGAGDEGAPSFTAMTFNVGDVAQPVFPVVETVACILTGGKPDILFLQEIPGASAGAKLQAELAYPYWSRAAVGHGKLSGLMVLSVFPIVAAREIRLPTQGKGAGALCADLELGGERVTACSVHLDEVAPKARNARGEVEFGGRDVLTILRNELFNDTVRSESAQALTDVIRKDAATAAVILSGDFNTMPGSRTIRHMSARFRDVLWPRPAYFTGTYHKIAFPVNPRIDYIFVSERLAVQHAQVIQKSAGDHYSVKAVMNFNS